MVAHARRVARTLSAVVCLPAFALVAGIVAESGRRW
jgi:hypothetical protein